MVSLRLVVLAALCSAAAVFVTALPLAAARSGTIDDAVSRADGAEVNLDGLVIDEVSPGLLLVREPWICAERLLVRTDVYARKWWSIEVSGRMTTIAGRRVLDADGVWLYTDSADRPFLLWPKTARERVEWPYMRRLASEAIESPADIGSESRDIVSVLTDPPPDPEPSGPPEPLSAEEGTIAYARLYGGGVELEGKVVTAVFGNPVEFFYVQEADEPCGIKVVMDPSVPVEPGNVVSVKGVARRELSDAECWIDAYSVRCTGSRTLPNPIGLSGRCAAGGEFGIQPALFCDSSTEGAGLNAVGSRARLWGRVTAVGGGGVFYIDDGSCLRRGQFDGIRVAFIGPGSAPAWQADDYVYGVTGVLGAEISEDSVPVPVLRVECPAGSDVWYVRSGGSGSKSGMDWANAFDSVQDAIDAASPGDEVWVAAGTYYEQIELEDGVRVYGGFEGDETVREQRDWVTNETVLDADGLGSVVTAGSGVTSSARIDGFTITGGDAYLGGGMFCYEAGPMIANNTIAANRATYGYGGGVYCECGLSAAPLLYSNTITGNEAGYYGGGVYCTGSALVTIIANDIVGNSAGEAGGGVCADYAPVALIGNSVIGNECVLDGGGVLLNSTAPGSAIRANLVTGNVGRDGAGIYCYDAAVSITNNLMCDNEAAQYGGGLYCYDQGSNSSVINNTVCHNTGGNTGGVSTSPSVQVVNNIIAFNSSGVYYEPGMVLTNNCVYGNTNGNYVGYTPDPDPNVTSDPLFVDANNGDYHLDVGSPCLDAGLDSYVGWSTDLDGAPRKQDAHVDIGAYETAGCEWYRLTLSADPLYAPLEELIWLTATVRNQFGYPVGGWPVTFQSAAGDLATIHSHTRSDGTAQATITHDVPGWIAAEAVISRPCEGETGSRIDIRFYDTEVVYKTGFIVDLCDNSQDIGTHIDDFLASIETDCPWVDYAGITGTPFSIDPSLSTLFVAMPARDLQTEEISALAAFVQSGREKRVVLVGEHNYAGYYSAHNARLNAVAAGIGIGARFSTVGCYDSGVNRHRLCAVNPYHYLTAGVSCLWNAATSTFATGWDVYARPLTYIYEAPALPWILEEDTLSAGSVVLVHDSSMMRPEYGGGYDLAPDRNFRFIGNLCSVYPQ